MTIKPQTRYQHTVTRFHPLLGLCVPLLYFKHELYYHEKNRDIESSYRKAERLCHTPQLSVEYRSKNEQERARTHVCCVRVVCSCTVCMCVRVCMLVPVIMPHLQNGVLRLRIAEV